VGSYLNKLLCAGCASACPQADITAKGESVANLADILGTLAGIMLSKWKLPMVPTFVVLSCGYLLASRKEVDSVELPYLNRARLALTSTHFLKTGGCAWHALSCCRRRPARSNGRAGTKPGFSHDKMPVRWLTVWALLLVICLDGRRSDAR
jgi:hypothetical protein